MYRLADDCIKYNGSSPFTVDYLLPSRDFVPLIQRMYGMNTAAGYVLSPSWADVFHEEASQWVSDGYWTPELACELGKKLESDDSDFKD